MGEFRCHCRSLEKITGGSAGHRILVLRQRLLEAVKEAEGLVEEQEVVEA